MRAYYRRREFGARLFDRLPADRLEHVDGKTEEYVHDARIEVRARRPLDLAPRRLQRDGPRIGAVERHGVEGIGDGEDAGAQRDLLALEAERVAGAVPALVVVVHDRHRPAQERDL